MLGRVYLSLEESRQISCQNNICPLLGILKSLLPKINALRYFARATYNQRINSLSGSLFHPFDLNDRIRCLDNCVDS